MQERVGLVYILVCLVNGKGYVGQTVRKAAVRWAEHVYTAFVKKSEAPLYRAMRKYGVHNFVVEVIWSGPEAKLNAAEKRYIRLHKTFIDGGCGYNLTTGGGAFKMSAATRRKIAARQKAYYAVPEMRAQLSEMMTNDWAKANAAEKRKLTAAAQRLRTAKLRAHYRAKHVKVNHGDIIRADYAANPVRRERVSRSLKAFNAAYPEVRQSVAEKLRGRHVHTSTGKDLFRDLAKKQWASEEGRAKKLAGMTGKKRSGAALVNMQAAGAKRRGRKRDSQAVETTAASLRIHWSDPVWRARKIAGMVGKRRSLEARENISRALTGKKRPALAALWQDSTYRAQQTAARSGRSVSAATRKLLAAKMAERELDPDYRTRHSEALKRAWAGRKERMTACQK